MSKKDSSMAAPKIVLVGDGVAGFPDGYANEYMRRFAKGIILAGGSVYLAIPSWKAEVLTPDTRARGVIDGIEFEHLVGVSAGTFPRPRRLWLRFRSWLMLPYRLRSLHRQGRLQVVVYAPWEFYYLPSLHRTCRALKVPLVLHFMEWPLAWPGLSEKERQLFDIAYTRALRCADAFVVISQYLVERCREANQSMGLERPIINFPILLDSQVWQAVGKVARPRPYFLFCASLDGYLADNLFLVESFYRSGCADHDLLMIGRANDETRNSIKTAAKRWGVSERVDIATRYLPQAELLGLYAGADALLAPLHDDHKSRARFPSKLADYLYSGRPVVSNPVGEVGRYLADGISAFLAPPDQPALFGQKMREAVTDPARFAIGERGKRLAETEFGLEVQGRRLATFLHSVTTASR